MMITLKRYVYLKRTTNKIGLNRDRFPTKSLSIRIDFLCLLF